LNIDFLKVARDQLILSLVVILDLLNIWNDNINVLLHLCIVEFEASAQPNPVGFRLCLAVK